MNSNTNQSNQQLQQIQQLLALQSNMAQFNPQQQYQLQQQIDQQNGANMAALVSNQAFAQNQAQSNTQQIQMAYNQAAAQAALIQSNQQYQNQSLQHVQQLQNLPNQIQQLQQMQLLQSLQLQGQAQSQQSQPQPQGFKIADHSQSQQNQILQSLLLNNQTQQRNQSMLAQQNDQNLQNQICQLSNSVQVQASKQTSQNSVNQISSIQHMPQSANPSSFQMSMSDSTLQNTSISGSEKEKFGASVDFNFFLQNEKLEHQFLMLQYKMSQCTNHSHYEPQSHGDPKELGLGCRGVLGGPPNNCMGFHSVLDMRRALFPKNEDDLENQTQGNKCLLYSHELCPHQKLGNQEFNPQFVCVQRESCKFSHSEIEILYHPAVFKTQACRDMGHIQIRVHSMNNLPMSQFSQQQLESYSMCPHYHDELNDKRDQVLAQNYMTFKQSEDSENSDSKQMETFKQMMDQYSQQPNDQKNPYLMQDMFQMFQKLQLQQQKSQDQQPQQIQATQPNSLTSQNLDLLQKQQQNKNSFQMSQQNMSREGSSYQQSFDQHQIMKRSKGVPSSHSMSDLVSQGSGTFSGSISRGRTNEIQFQNQKLVPNSFLIEHNGDQYGVGIDFAAKLSKNQRKKLYNKQYPSGKNIKPDISNALTNQAKVDGVMQQDMMNQKMFDNASPNITNVAKQVNIQNVKNEKKQAKSKQQQAKNAKREKIFIDIYSSYLQIKNSSSPQPRGNLILETMQEAEIIEESNDRELTPITRQPNIPTANLPEGPHESAKKLGLSQIIKYLDLSKFKIQKCQNLTNGRQHNHRHCRYYHTNKDKRRVLDYSGYSNILAGKVDLLPGETYLQKITSEIYTPDLQVFSDRKDDYEDPMDQTCQVSLNRVESVYHPEKYKSKYCTKYPKNLNKCEYGDYCSFAHSTKELKTRLIHQMKKDADFYLFYFKTEWCPFNKEHNKAQCVYAHNWQDFRRKPNIFNYDCNQLCENWKPGTFIAKYHEGCAMQASCKHSHGWKEQEYHPLYYKTLPCKEDLADGKSKCSRGIECPYFHSAKDKREPEMVKQQRDRSDFVYDKILEMSMNLSNVNQLQELILIKVAELLTPHKKQKEGRVFYLENQITEQNKKELVQKGVFRDITLHCMVSRKVLQEAFFVPLKESKKKEKGSKNDLLAQQDLFRRLEKQNQTAAQQPFINLAPQPQMHPNIINMQSYNNQQQQMFQAGLAQSSSNRSLDQPCSSITFQNDKIRKFSDENQFIYQYDDKQSPFRHSSNPPSSGLNQICSQSSNSHHSYDNMSGHSNQGILGMNDNMNTFQDNWVIEQKMLEAQDNTHGLMQQYFSNKHPKVQNYSIKKFASEKFDANEIQQVIQENDQINMDSLVEEITQEENDMPVQRVSSASMRPTKIYERQNSIFSRESQKQIYGINQESGLIQIKESEEQENEINMSNQNKGLKKMGSGLQPSNQQWNNMLESINYEKVSYHDGLNQQVVVESVTQQSYSFQNKNQSPDNKNSSQPMQNIEFYSREKLLKKSTSNLSGNANTKNQVGDCSKQVKEASKASKSPQSLGDDPFFYDDKIDPKTHKYIVNKKS